MKGHYWVGEMQATQRQGKQKVTHAGFRVKSPNSSIGSMDLM